MKDERELYPQDEGPNPLLVLVYGLIILALSMLLVWGTATMANASEGDCDYAESLITDALKDEPKRLVAHLEGKEMNKFFSNLSNKGYLTGTLWKIDGIYIVDGGKMKGYEDSPDQVWIFFIQDGCILTKVPALKSVIVELL